MESTSGAVNDMPIERILDADRIVQPPEYQIVECSQVSNLYMIRMNFIINHYNWNYFIGNHGMRVTPENC